MRVEGVLNEGFAGLGDQGVLELTRRSGRAITQARFAGNAIGPVGATALAQAPWPGLEVLDLYENALGPRGVAALLRGAPLGVSSLNVCGNAIGPEGARHLAQAAFPRLQKLHLGFDALGDTGAHALAAHAGGLGALEELNLRLNGIEPEGAGAIARGFGHHVRRLSFEDNPIGDRGARLLAEADGSAIEALDLAGCELTIEGVRALRGSRTLDPAALDLSHNELTDEALDVLLESWGGLRRVVLEGNRLSAKALERIAEAPGLEAVEGLWLAGNPLGDGPRLGPPRSIPPRAVILEDDGMRVCFP